MLKVKSTVSQLPGVSVHSTVKLTPAVNLTPVMVGAGGGAGEGETMTLVDEKQQVMKKHHTHAQLSHIHQSLGISNL